MADKLKKKVPKKAPDEIYVMVGARIREARLANEMTQVAFAKFLGVTFQQVQKYERGQNRISLSQLIKIAKKFKFNLGEFLESLKGEDEGVTHYNNNVNLIRYYKMLDKEDQNMMYSTIKVMANNKERSND